MARDERGCPRIVLDDEPRALALLATAYEQPVKACVVAKLRRACERWTEGEKALAHIHLAHAGLLPCGPDRALRLFVADELIEAGVTPRMLMKAQGLDPAPLALLKFNPDQPRVPAGSGRESGEWTSGDAGNGRENGGSTSDDANIAPVAFRSRSRHGRGGRFDWIDRFLELFRERRKQPTPEEKPREPEVAKPETESVRPPAAAQGISTPKPSDFVGEDFGKLGIGIEKPDLEIAKLILTPSKVDRGVSLNDLQDTVDHPLIVLQQSRGRVYYLSDKAAVVLNPRGRVITTYSASDFDTKIRALLEHVHK
jgi:hypothetical protein